MDLLLFLIVIAVDSDHVEEGDMQSDASRAQGGVTEMSEDGSVSGECGTGY